MVSTRPSTEWGLSPIEQRFIIIRFVVVLADCLKQFSMYNVYKDGGYGLDLVQDVSPNNGVKMHKLLPKHALILRPVYSLVNEMKFWVVSNPLPRTNAPENRMYEANQNPKYECYKYTKGFIDVRVTNVANYKEIIKYWIGIGLIWSTGFKIICQIGVNLHR